MQHRENIVRALWQRLSSVSGVNRTARNPVKPPNEDSLPCINFFEMPDTVTSTQKRGAGLAPAYKREFQVIIEAFTVADTEPEASVTIINFVDEIKKQLYAGGVTLGLKGVEIEEVESGMILRPPDMEKIAGIGIVLKIRYAEDVSQLFT